MVTRRYVLCGDSCCGVRLVVQCAAQSVEILRNAWRIRACNPNLVAPLEYAHYFSTLVGAALIGFIGVHLSHRYLAHPKVFTVAAIIPMIPGVHAYKAMIAIVQIHHYGFSDELFSQMINSFINTTFILGALVFGLALPGLLFYRGKPVV